MNKKRGLKRVWIVVSIFWVAICGFLISQDGVGDIVDGLVFMVSILLVWWGLFYSSLWIASGFSGGDERKSETDE